MRRNVLKTYGKGAKLRLAAIVVGVTAATWCLLTAFNHSHPARDTFHIFSLKRPRPVADDPVSQEKGADGARFAKLAVDQAKDKSEVTSIIPSKHASDQEEASIASPKESSSLSISRQTDTCHIRPNTEYGGDVLKWGVDNIQESAGACCQQCRDMEGCNTWVWCAQPEGCAQDRHHKQCWLKRQASIDLEDIHTRSQHPGIRWTSGAFYSDAAMQKVVDAEAARLRKLREDPALPLVWLEVSIKGQVVGRIVIALFSRESPRSAENFRALCTGEKGTVPEGHEGAGSQYHFKGKAFYRIIDQFIDQAGAGTDSVFGGQFKDDAGGLKLKHNRKGLLSMANTGSDTNTSHFSIMMNPAPHLDGKYTIFGEVIEGFEVAEKINALSRDQPNQEAGAQAAAVISDSGQIRCGEPCGTTGPKAT